jgi:hypothetical protein
MDGEIQFRDATIGAGTTKNEKMHKTKNKIIKWEK